MDSESERAAKVDPLDDILPHWERSMTLTPKDALERVNSNPEPDYPKFEEMMAHWESFVEDNARPEVHLYWKEGLEEARRRFTTGPRPASEIQKLVKRAIDGRKSDLRSIKSRVQTASHVNPILEEEVCQILPIKLARLMGMGPPNDSEFSASNPRPEQLWEGYYSPKLRRQSPDSRTRILIAHLLASVRDMHVEELASFDDMKATAMIWYQELEIALTGGRYTDWMRTWEEDFPEVAAPLPQRSVARTMGMAVVTRRGEWREPESREVEDWEADGGEIRQETSITYDVLDLISEQISGRMETSPMDVEDEMDMD
ncbi:uncharacterized protein Triagg1_442 [Trichoderma aggressivum f. europaeum]|uniref:Uncharacterized protein n=1 Tax=Trichoderma aggressivum f. europaeum TaxID=173218 RepID=A0AAE1IKC1_9HYPO|nr:hypothetical protein Triagg1_442 [Trichoderma aggressivum f. europaeum]